MTAVEIRRAVPVDRPALSRMLELYQHDLSDIWDQDLDAGGEYGGRGAGYAGVENPLFFKENTRMYLGDARGSMEKLVAVL